MSKNYWQEAIECAFEEVGLKATKEQIEDIAGYIETSHENYGMAHGYDCVPNQAVLDRDKFKDLYKKEKNKRGCPVCSGKGYTERRFTGLYCYKCNGEGKI